MRLAVLAFCACASRVPQMHYHPRTTSCVPSRYACHQLSHEGGDDRAREVESHLARRPRRRAGRGREVSGILRRFVYSVTHYRYECHQPVQEVSHHHACARDSPDAHPPRRPEERGRGVESDSSRLAEIGPRRVKERARVKGSCPDQCYTRTCARATRVHPYTRRHHPNVGCVFSPPQNSEL